MEKDIDGLNSSINGQTAEARKQLSAVYFSSAILCTSDLTLSVFSLITDTFPATFCIVEESCPESEESQAELFLEALVLFKTSPVMLLIRPELSWIVFKILFIGVIT